MNQTELCSIGPDQYLLFSAKHNVLLVSTLSLTSDNLTVLHTSHTLIGNLEISGLFMYLCVLIINLNLSKHIKCILRFQT